MGEFSMGTRKSAGDESGAVEVAKTPRAAKKATAPTAGAKTAKKKPGAPKGEPKPKSRNPLRKNMKRGEKATQVKPIAEIVPAPPTLAEELGLTTQEAVFVDCYLVHFNGRRAYQEAGYQSKSDGASSSAASHLLRRPNVAEYLRRRSRDMIERVEDEQNKLITVLTYTAYADHNELIENRIDCCRFCYGENHLYQFTPNEFERYKERHAEECAAAVVLGNDPPVLDPKGGIGFNPNLEPFEDCPECFGRGREAIVLKDTRYLSPAAQALYAGVKTTKDGIEVLTNNQGKARETLAKIHKLYDDSTKVNVSFDPQELETRFGEGMKNARARSQEMLEDRRKAREERGDS